MSRHFAVLCSSAVLAAVAVSLAFAAGGGGGAATGTAPGTSTASAPAGRGGRGAGGGRGAANLPPLPASEGVVLPKSVPADGRPQINGPRITGATPGRPFIYKVPFTGDNVTISIDGLPEGLTLDSKTGQITGSLKTALAKAVTIRAKNDKGEASKQFVIVGGKNKLALTPPLGWNSWNCYGGSVTQQQMQDAADGMVKSGLAAHGFQYLNLDDGWEYRPPGGRGANLPPEGGSTRAPDGTILVNPKFPSMKGLGDYIHAKGLKFGIYSGPGPTTCQGLEASWQHEDQDARTWASWGVDYIKYDWCGYSSVVQPAPAGTARTFPINPGGGRPQIQIDFEDLKKPYRVMRASLDKLDRDMVYSLCQYGWGSVWEWGADPDIKGDLWRTTGDIETGVNVWTSMAGIGFAQNGRQVYAGPQHWNDTDMLVVGSIGLAFNGQPRPTYLTQNEQLTHIGLWAMLAAPLLLGCDMNSMDEYTTNLMCNDEMLAIDQDPLGKQAWRIAALSVDDAPVTTTPASVPASAPATATTPATGAGPATATAPGGRGRGGARGGRGGNPQNSAAKQIWVRPLWDGTYAVGLFNLSETPQTISVSFADLSKAFGTTLTGSLPVRDVWQLKDLAPANGAVTATVPRHGMAFLKVGTPKPEAESINALVQANLPK